MALSIVGKAWRMFREEGLGAVLKTVRRRIWLVHRAIWFELPLNESVSVIKPRFDGWLDFDHPDRIIQWIEERNLAGTNDPTEMASMKRRGQYFVGVMNGEEIAGYIKLGWDKVYVMDYQVDVVMPKGYYFIIDIYIDPAHRGLGAGPFLVSAAAAAMRDKGYRGSVMHVRVDKTPMLRTAATTGYKEIGRVRFTRIMGRRLFSQHPARMLEAVGR